jgi:cytochrome c-type biogenesis protein CcmH
MTLFWTITAAMIVAALALLAPSLLRRHAAGSDATEQFNVAIAREHLAELVKQREAGDLSDEEFVQAKQDLELALAQDLEGTHGASVGSAGAGGRWALPVAALLIPLITIPLYLQIGSPQMIGKQSAANNVAAGHGNTSELPPLGELVGQLRERMEANPENAEGWFLLGRTYMRLQQYPDAVYAFEHVVELLPNETAGLLSLADAMAMREGGRVGVRAVELLERALQIDPNSVTALWLLGNAAADRGDTAAALGYWRRAHPMLADQPAMQSELGLMIRNAGGEPPPTPAALPSIMGAATAGARAGTSATTAAATEAATGGDQGASIVVEVALAPALMEQVAPTDTVFVLARAENGPPMPLAVARHEAGELPLRITLTDAMAMMPAMKLSSFPRVKVSAKVSKSGQPTTQPGDMVAPDILVDSGNPPATVQLLINEVSQ